MARLARSIEDVLLGEGVHGTNEERYEDFLGIASVIQNRAALHGVTPHQIVSARRQFDAYGRALPAGVEKYRALAKEAWEDVQANGAIHGATYYATPSRVKALPGGLSPVASTKGHQYFIDPEFRPITTSVGVKRANPTVAQELINGLADPAMAYTAVPERRPELAAFDAITNTPLDAGAQTAIENAVAQDGFNELGAVEREGYGSPFGAMGDRITSGFGLRDRPKTSLGVGSRFHQGVDLSLGPGAANYPTEAVAGGVVSRVYSSPTLGNTVEVLHDDGFTSRYSHLNEIGNVEAGQEVARGTPIGMVGRTGNSGASHLHFSMLDDKGNLVDPASVVDFNRQNSLPTPTAADRRQPGQMVSDIANAAISPSLGDPNDALAASFNMDRFAGPAQGEIANFDAGRFGDPNAVLAESFDMARLGAREAQPAQGEKALADALAASNNQAAMRSQQMADLQTRANEARRVLEEQAAQSAQATQSASLGAPVAVDGQAAASTGVSAAADAAGIAPRSIADLAGQYAAYGAGKVSPEQNLAADVFEQALSTKQARTPSYALAQQKIDQTQAVDPTVDAASLASPEALGDLGVDMADVTYSQPSRAKQAVQQREMVQQPEAIDPDKGRLARSFTNSKTMGTALGATIGGMIGGPVGALALGALGSKLGNMPAAERPRETPLQALFNMMTGKPQSMYPTTPTGGYGTGRGVSFNDLNDFGRDQYNESGDFRDAIDKGGVGLY